MKVILKETISSLGIIGDFLPGKHARSAGEGICRRSSARAAHCLFLSINR